MLNTAQGWATEPDAILKTTDGGAKWLNVTPADLPADLGFQGGFFVDATTGWVPYTWVCPRTYCARPRAVGGLLRTTNGGTTWHAFPLAWPDNQPGCTESLDFVDRSHGWLMVGHCGAAGSEAVDVYRTTDGGALWQRVSGASFAAAPPSGSLPVGGDKNGLAFANAMDGCVTGDMASPGLYLYRTTDGGVTWYPQTLPNPPGVDLVHAYLGTTVPQFLNQRDGVLVVNAGDTIVYTTDDGGATWHPNAVVSNREYIGADFVSGETAWAYNPANHTPVETRNGGKTWRALSLPNGAYGFDLLSAETAFVWGQAPVLWRSTDGWRAWHRIPMRVAPAN